MKRQTSIRISRFFIGLILCASPLGLSAQTVEFIIEPPIVQLGQAATAEFRVRGVRQAIRPDLPKVDGLEFSYRGQTMKMTTLNGKTDQFIAHQFSIIPLKAGDYSIGPFTYKMGVSTFGIPERKLKVVSQGGQEIDWESMLFMEMEAKTNALFVGQTIDVDFSLYSRTGLQLEGRITPQQLPSAGVTIKEMNELASRRQEVDGNDFQVRRFRITFQVLTAGAFTFEPEFQVNVLMQAQQRNRRLSFDPFGSVNQYQRLPMTLSPEAMTLTVLNLPQDNRPENYEGAVGKFQMDVTLRPTSLAVGEPVTIQTVLSGQGNVESITSPTFNPGDGFRIYESKMISSDLNKAGSSGRKIYEQVLIPRTEGDNIVPEISFSFFNPEERQYKTITEGPFTLELMPSASAEQALVVGNANQPSSSPIEVLNEDIAYLKSEPGTWRNLNQGPLGTPPLPSTWIHIIASCAVLAGAGVFKFRTSKPQDVVKKRRMQAPGNARKGLEKTKTLIQSGQTKEAFERLYETISNFSSHLYNWAPGEFDQAKLKTILTTKNLEEQDIDQVLSVLNEAESLRYGGTVIATENILTVDQVDQIGILLTQIERAS